MANGREGLESSPHSQRRTSMYITNTADTVMVAPSTANKTNGIARHTPLTLLRESPLHHSFVAYAVGDAYPKQRIFGTRKGH
jgi:hypothetical protein